MKEYKVSCVRCDNFPEFIKSVSDFLLARKMEGRPGRLHINFDADSTEGLTAIAYENLSNKCQAPKIGMLVDAPNRIMMAAIFQLHYRGIFHDGVFTIDEATSVFYDRLRKVVAHKRLSQLMRMYFSRSWDIEYAASLQKMQEVLGQLNGNGLKVIEQITSQETRLSEDGIVREVHLEELNSLSESVRMLAEKAQLGLFCKMMYGIFNEEKKSGGSN